ncbi:MAG TPA: phospholipase D-like domain-containing protein [Polyangia bacterium]|jgi:phosphatidylserine/phosphatidylglycerophosphate/cardiolipin synthase-like enzyme
MTRARLPRSLLLFLVLAALLGPGCGQQTPEAGPPTPPPPDLPDGGPETPPPDLTDGGPETPLPEATAYLEIYALDIWGQPLPVAGTSLGVAKDGAWLPLAGFPVTKAALTTSGTYYIQLRAPLHDDLAIAVAYNGSASLTAATLGRPAGDIRHGVSLTHEVRTVGSAQKTVHTAYLGLRHKWFSAAGRPARRGNAIELLMDGEEAWQRVHGDLTRATDSVLASTWWWESDFELVRSATNLTATTAERWPNTILGTLETLPAQKRILVGQFWGQDSMLSWMTNDARLRAYAETPGDGFEFMGQANETSGQFWFEPTPFTFADRVKATYPETAGRTFVPEEPIKSTVPPHAVDLDNWPVGITFELGMASYHQKFMVVDHAVAYIGGMNFRRVDWDTSAHRYFEPRRMLFDATAADRQAVADKTRDPDTGPRKDYIMRVAGPAAQDAADVFHERWRYALDTGVTYADMSTDFAVRRDIGAVAGGLQVQVTATLPQPFWEHAIAETWFNAVAQATDYIYIEDQYFRIPMLSDAIIARMQAVPTLKLVVITKPINEWTDPGCEWTYKSVANLTAEVGDRFTLLQLRAFDSVVTWGVDETEARFADLDTHAKILVVDDTFLSVGSANKNNRGLIYEAELTVAVADRDFVTAQRRRLLAAILPPGTAASDASTTWIQQLRDAAAWNDSVYQNWDAEGGDLNLNGAPLPAEYTPHGFVYGLAFRGSDYCFIEGVSPDMF